jgi:hypothetical protein
MSWCSTIEEEDPVSATDVFVEHRNLLFTGAPGLHILVDGLVDGRVETVVSAVLEDGLIAGLYAVRNPAKLGRLDALALTR